MKLRSTPTTMGIKTVPIGSPGVIQTAGSLRITLAILLLTYWVYLLLQKRHRDAVCELPNINISK